MILSEQMLVTDTVRWDLSKNLPFGYDQQSYLYVLRDQPSRPSDERATDFTKKLWSEATQVT